MVEELQKQNRMELLNRKDSEGNTVLHTATVRKQVQILKMLFPTNAHPLVQVNSRTREGFTALDLHRQNVSPHRYDKDISEILHQAGAKEGHLLGSCLEERSSLRSAPPGVTNIDTTNKSMSSKMKLVALGVLIAIAGAAFSSLTTLTNITTIYPLPLQKHLFEISMVSAKDVIMAPMLLPNIFSYMVFSTATFMSSLVVILLISCSFKWSFCYRVVSLFVIGAFAVSYAFLAKEVMPKFWVTVGSHRISSFWFMWFYDSLVACSTVTGCLIGKLIHYIFSKLLKKPSMDENRPNKRRVIV